MASRLNVQAALATFLVALPLGAQQLPVSGQPVPELSVFDTLMPQIMSQWSIPGATIAITKDGRLVFARGYGWADRANSVPVQPDSLFRIASISKPFTAAAILKLIEQGRLQLSTTPFTSILSDLTPPPGEGEDVRVPQITILNLLEHRGGWDRDIAGDPPFVFADAAAQTFGATPPATPELLVRYMLGKTLQYNPGSTFSYSNFGYMVLGLVIERVSGMAYEDYVRQYILTPANIQRMRLGDTFLNQRATDEVNYYDYPGAPLVGSVFPPVGSLVPAPYGGFSMELMKANAGWIASTMDLLRYVDIMNGELQPSILQSPSTFASVCTPQPGGSYCFVPITGSGYWWSFYGSLNGTNTILHSDRTAQTSGDISWSVLFNTRSGSSSSQPQTDADTKILNAVQGITVWPALDLFPTYSSSSSACSFSLSNTNTGAAAEGGSGLVSVNDANYCAWTAVSGTSWLTITSGANGFQSGAVTFTAAANPSAQPRSGTLTIAGQTFTVNQSASSGTITLAPANVDFGDQCFGVNSASQTVTLINTSGSPLTVGTPQLPAGANPADFPFTSNCGASQPGGTTCAITVSFQPTGVGPRSTSLTFSFNGGSVLQTVNLTGAGITPADYVAGKPGDVRLSADFDGDGKSDFVVWRPSSGTWFVLTSSGGTHYPNADIQQQWGLPGDVPVPGDYDGDGKADFAVWRPSSGTWFILPSLNPSQPIVQQWGLAGDVPVVGDFNGDGILDFAVWRPNEGNWYVLYRNAGSAPGPAVVQQWGLPGDVPVPGDYDGDHRTDFAVWRPSSGTWFIIPSSQPSQPIVQQWGLAGDIPLVGDFDADGRTDFAVWRPVFGSWLILTRSGAGQYPNASISQQWGLPRDIPLIGDFDGDRKVDFAVWRPTDGGWYVITSGHPNTFPLPNLFQQWGLSGDVPN